MKASHSRYFPLAAVFSIRLPTLGSVDSGGGFGFTIEPQPGSSGVRADGSERSITRTEGTRSVVWHPTVVDPPRPAVKLISLAEVRAHLPVTEMVTQNKRQEVREARSVRTPAANKAFQPCATSPPTSPRRKKESPKVGAFLGVETRLPPRFRSRRRR